MNQAGVNFIKFHPEQFFAFLKDNNYPVYHRSPIFFRDFQYGLWRFLQESQTKVAYADIERIAHEVIEDFEARGLVRKISRQNYELRMPEFTTVFPTAEEGKVATAPPQGKPAPASGPAATQAPAATPAAAPAAAAAPAVNSADEKARKIAELQAKMAAAKAAKEGGAAAPAPAAPAAAPAATPGAPAASGDDEKARKIAELQAKMAAAKAAKEGGAAAPAAAAALASPDAVPASAAPSPAAATAPTATEAASVPAAAAAPAAAPAASASGDDKAAKLAELQAKMAEAKRRRESGETSPNSPA